MKTFLRGFPILALVWAALGCNLPRLFATETPEFTALETAAQQTLSARLTQAVPSATTPVGVPTATAPSTTLTTAVPTATTVPPTAAPPTIAIPTTLVPAVVIVPPTPAINYQATAYAQSVWATQHAAPPLPAAGRIRFAAGATSGQVTGTLPGGAAVDYLIAAGNGQTMLASVYSPNNDVYLGVSGAGGQPLLRPSAGQTTFTGVLPGTQDYRLTLAAPPQGSPYTLQVIIPARIQFAPGAISASVPGQLAGGETNYYLARAAGGQTMAVRILSPSNDIFLTIYGMSDGSPLVRSVMGQSAWSGVLPMSQDYMIQTVSTGGPAGYSLEITIQ